jgi:hypothetical protein
MKANLNFSEYFLEIVSAARPKLSALKGDSDGMALNSPHAFDVRACRLHLALEMELAACLIRSNPPHQLPRWRAARDDQDRPIVIVWCDATWCARKAHRLFFSS